MVPLSWHCLKVYQFPTDCSQLPEATDGVLGKPVPCALSRFVPQSSTRLTPAKIIIETKVGVELLLNLMGASQCECGEVIQRWTCTLTRLRQATPQSTRLRRHAKVNLKMNVVCLQLA
jgi:hypothetical protein